MNFSSHQIPENIRSSMRAKNIWNESCPVPLEKLRILNLTHYDFAGNLCAGEMIVHQKIAENVLLIFKELLSIKFPIEKIRLIDHYNGNDELSMADNNSSCFNYRMIAGSELVSMHSYGLAIDINPVQNPYIVIPNEMLKQVQHDIYVKIYPAAGKTYLNRRNQRYGMVEPIVPIFAKYGLVWGGDWNSPIDYHHFQVDRAALKEFL